MNPEISEWLLLLIRWLHITVGITWIGTSIFFMWLDRTFEFNEKSNRPGHIGDLWMVHGGGFYHVEKLQMGPTQVPEYLHWFKWESYWTWASGILLLWFMFYAGGGALLLDPTTSSLTYGEALAIGVGTVLVSWFAYDFVWELALTRKNPIVGHVFTFLWIVLSAYFLCQTLSGRAAYMHMGAVVGTWMTGNVFLRIIPRQIQMVEASKRGEAVNADWPKNAKNRSTHNTYLTLPIIFIMLSNHFPSTYGNPLNWLILLGVSISGALIRHFFLIRKKDPVRSRGVLVGAIVLLVSVIYFTRENV